MQSSYASNGPVNNVDGRRNSVDTPPQLLLLQQLQFLYRNWRIGVAGHLIFGSLVVLYFWPSGSVVVLLGWLAALAVVVAGRIATLASFARITDPTGMVATNATPWLRRVLVLMALHGLVWGCAGPLLVPPDSITYASIMLLALAAVSGGVVASLSAHFGAVVTFIAPALMPYGIMLAASNGPGERPLGIAALFFAVAMILYARAANRTVLHALRIQADNARLIDRLDEESLSTAALNRQLMADIARREKVESELRLTREHAEHMADRLSLASALDGLTGLTGSRHFEDVLKREWTRAARGGTPLAIILCDVDAYAAFCERYGHDRGDELLRLVAHVLLLHARRANDLISHTGEQRFALLMPLAETSQATKVAEQIREAVQALGVENDASPIADQVTVSLGVASFIPQKGMNFKILEQTADNMLKAATKGGYNRVCAYHPTLA